MKQERSEDISPETSDPVKFECTIQVQIRNIQCEMPGTVMQKERRCDQLIGNRIVILDQITAFFQFRFDFRLDPGNKEALFRIHRQFRKIFHSIDPSAEKLIILIQKETGKES